VGAGTNLLAAAAILCCAKRRSKPGEVLLLPANLLTLSRLLPAAMLCGRASAPGLVGFGRLEWLALLWGATGSDWLDGPVARRYGTTQLGALLDLEADSWLTLWAAAAAVRTGSLPAFSLVPPAGRYPAALVGHSRRAGAAPWQRAAGSLQMAVLLSALSPWPRLRAGRRLAAVAAAAQAAALGADLAPRISRG
jgi:phosphatidylglycerophosphate synthase